MSEPESSRSGPRAPLVPAPPPVPAREIAAVTRLGASMRQIDAVLDASLEALGKLIDFDLATVMELDGDELAVRVARGPLDGPRIREHRLRLSEFPSIRRVLAEGQARPFLEDDHAHGDGDPFDGVLDLPHGHCCMVVPLRLDESPIGLMTFDRQRCEVFPDEVVQLADVFGRLLALVIGYGEQSWRLDRLREQLEEQNRALTERFDDRSDACAMLEACPSPAMAHVVSLARRVAPTATPVLITGETGTGKEVLAKAIRGWSDRASRPLVTLNCAALPAGLIESELFGHVKGAFSGATGSRIGRFRAANGGTLFLDEIGELPIDLQAKLLRVLQEGRFEPVGSDHTVRVDVRIIAATNADLREACARRTFREDLYYRLAVFLIPVPPLRERAGDVAAIATSFLRSLSRRTGAGPWEIPERELRRLEARDWPGNVRELVNTLERATILARGPRLGFGAREAPLLALPEPGEPEESAPLPTLAAMEREHIERALRKTGGKIYGPGGAAELLDINASTLQSRMRKHGLGGARAAKRRLE